MKIYLANIGEKAYAGFNMSELNLLLQRIDQQIAILEKEKLAVKEVLKIESRHKNGNTKAFIDEMLNSRNSDSAAIFAEPEEIERAILKINGNFKLKDIPASILTMFPKKTFTKNAITTTLNRLINTKKLYFVQERNGRTPAIYHKA
jgi:hypothetical protein